jgi:hypothetical protein
LGNLIKWHRSEVNHLELRALVEAGTSAIAENDLSAIFGIDIGKVGVTARLSDSLSLLV